MKLLVLTEGGGAKGFGHIARCAALTEAFCVLCPSSKVSFMIDTDDEMETFLQEHSAWDVKTCSWRKDVAGMLKVIQQSDMVIIDSYLAPPKTYNRISEVTGGKVIMIDDYGRIEYPYGIVLNPAVSIGDVKYPKESRVEYLYGAKYVTIRKSFWQTAKRDLNENVKKILLAFGGSFYPEFLKKIIDSLKNKYQLEIKYILPSQRYMQDVEKYKESIKILSELTQDEIQKEMSEADLCISGGGQTLYELARCMTPTIGISFALNQRNNLNALTGFGAIDYIGQYNSEDILTRLICAVDKNMCIEYRKAKIEKAKAVIDGNGALRVAEKALNVWSIREVEIRDSQDIYNWRNDERVRRWCCRNENISINDHEKWFNAKMKDSNTTMFIAENLMQKKLGQVRFDKTENGVLISTNLNPDFFGKGIGSELIRIATKRYMVDSKEKRILAQIKEGNTQSIKAFKKAGYKFLKEEERDNLIITTFVFNKG